LNGVHVRGGSEKRVIGADGVVVVVAESAFVVVVVDEIVVVADGVGIVGVS
jgi:hypothetical protein